MSGLFTLNNLQAGRNLVHTRKNNELFLSRVDGEVKYPLKLSALDKSNVN